MSASVIAFPERPIKPEYEKLEPFLKDAGTDSGSLFELAEMGMLAVETYRSGSLDTPDAQQNVVNGAFLAFAALGTVLGLISPPSTIEESPAS